MATYGTISDTISLDLTGSTTEEVGYRSQNTDGAATDTENTHILTQATPQDSVTSEPVTTNASRRYNMTWTGDASGPTASQRSSVRSCDAVPTEDTPLSSSFQLNITDHCHVRNKEGPAVDKRARCKLITASILCLLFMVAEVIGGVLSNSLALATDAAHLLTDFASFMISLLALFIASRPATRGMNFGWHRAEVMGALISVLMIWVVTGVLFYMAVLRVMSGEYEIQGTVMLITSALGIGFNIVMLGTLHDHGHSHGGHSHNIHHGNDNPTHTSDHNVDSEMNYEHNVHNDDKGLEKGPDESSESEKTSSSNINVRAAFIHVLGDLIQSFGVLLAALLVYFKPEYKLADPICTFIFSVLVLFTTINILRETLNVLMEGTPRGISFESVKDCLTTIPGVLELHNLRIWCLTINRTAIAVHLALAPDTDHQEISRLAGSRLRQRFGVYEFTIQTEQFVDDMKECTQCTNP